MIAHLVERYHFDVNADDTCGGLRDLHDLVGREEFEETPLDWVAVENNVTAVGSRISEDRYLYGTCLVYRTR